ncbi:MAG: hypothetical protein PHP50_14535 [Lachnospiraceae bacterium]|nr:hypothetical protein [Lachnospiraceae bacterium]
MAKQHRMKKDFSTGEEFLSGFTQKDSLISVITLTIYWGADEWTGPRRLSDMFRFDISPVKEYVNDYILNMIIPDTIEDFRKFKTEVGKVFQFIKASNSKKK